MTKEQKIEYLQNLSAEELLIEYETIMRRRVLDSSLLFDAESLEDVKLVRAEVLRRLDK